MKKEYSGECFSAFEAGYNIGYRQAQRDFKSLIERDKARTMHDLRCPSCDVVVYDDWSDFCSYCGQRFKRSWSE